MMNPMDMTGRTVLVTGASSGLGRDAAILLTQLGARVVISGRREDALRETLGMLEGRDHVVEPFDLDRGDEIPAWMKAVAGRVGPLAGLAHCAGVQVTKPLRMMTAAHVEGELRANVGSAFGLTKGFRQKGVCTTPRASIVFLTSIAGIVGNPGQTLYSAAKGALVAMTRSLALELVRDGITVNCVAPAMVESGMGERTKLFQPEAYDNLVRQHPLGAGKARDVSNGIAFLLADTGRWITGTTLVLDGGYSAQ